MIYRPEFFAIYELLPEDFYRAHLHLGERLWLMFDDRILRAAEQIRNRYGKMIANTWYWGGQHQYRGWRPFDCKVGAEISQHKFGRAIDLVPMETTAEEIRQDIIHRPETYSLMSAVEMGVPWLHIDCRNHNAPGILEVKP